MRMRAHFDGSSLCQLQRPELVEENERPYGSTLPRGQSSLDLKSAEVTPLRDDYVLKQCFAPNRYGTESWIYARSSRFFRISAFGVTTLESRVLVVVHGPVRSTVLRVYLCRQLWARYSNRVRREHRFSARTQLSFCMRARAAEPGISRSVTAAGTKRLR